MRDIIVRVWDKERKIFRYPDLWDSSMPSNWREFYELTEYTGLNDKHGKKIYNLDIVKHPQADEPEDLGWLVDWLGTEYVLQNVSTGEVESASGFINYVESMELAGMEIIGNRFENPELLTKLEKQD